MGPIGLKVFSCDSQGGQERIWRASLHDVSYRALLDKIKQITHTEDVRQLQYEADGELIMLDSQEAFAEALQITQTDKLGRRLLRLKLAPTSVHSTASTSSSTATPTTSKAPPLPTESGASTEASAGVAPNTEDEEAALNFIQRILRSLNEGTPIIALVLSLMPGGSLHAELEATVFKAYPALRKAATTCGSNPWKYAGGGCRFFNPSFSCHPQWQQEQQQEQQEQHPFGNANMFAAFEAAATAAAAAAAAAAATPATPSHPEHETNDSNSHAASAHRPLQQQRESSAKDFEEAIQRAIAASLKCTI